MENKSCMYCTQDSRCETQMLHVCSMRVSRVYILKNQYYKGRCVVAFGRHCEEIFQMSEGERNDFFEDVSEVAEAVKKLYAADKINYAIYGDEVPHVHMHIVPKHKEEDGWGGAFDMGKQGEPLSERELDRQAKELAAQLKKEV